MKTIYLLSLVLLSILILTFSCSKPEDGDEHCPEGYSGKNCDIQVTPDTVFITQINVTRFPANNVQEETWDATSDADIFVKLFQNDELFWTSTTVYQNADTATTYKFIDITVALFDPMAQYSIQLYDQDNASEDDFMGGISFLSYFDDNGFPELLILDDGGKVAFELDLEYFWE